jgi:hypothetical protein
MSATLPYRVQRGAGALRDHAVAWFDSDQPLEVQLQKPKVEAGSDAVVLSLHESVEEQVAETRVIAGVELAVRETPTQESEDSFVYIDYFLSNESGAFSELLGRLLAGATPPIEGYLSWERGTAVVQLVVDRESDAARDQAYAIEHKIALAIPNVVMRFRLLDVSDVEEAKRAGFQSLRR